MAGGPWEDVAAGERFAFGRNWARFLDSIDDRRIDEAERSLQQWLGLPDLKGKRFLDVGCGSGLFSLAARRLGARVHSFDFDPFSVACARQLRERYFPDDADWLVERGDILDEDYLRRLGQFDVVYAWGVLHHTGRMWQAMENVAALVAPHGRLFIAIYNDQGRASRWWAWVKRTYNRLPGGARFLVLVPAFLRLWGPTMIRDLLRARPFSTWKDYGRNRGMSPWHDVVDWVGGYPFEVAKPEKVFEFFRGRGWALEKLKTCGGGHGCNEFVFFRT